MDAAKTPVNTNSSSCHLRWEERVSGITSALLKDYTKGTFLDATLCCRDNKMIRTHRLMLAASSTFLATTFRSVAGLSGSEEVTIILPDFEAETLELLLRAVYHGEQFSRWSLDQAGGNSLQDK